MQICTRPKLSFNKPYKKLWGWDDYDRGGPSKKNTFVCYKCTGYLNTRDKFCSDCWTDNTRMFTWLQSLKSPYEEMNESTEFGADEVVFVFVSRALSEDNGMNLSSLLESNWRALKTRIFIVFRKSVGIMESELWSLNIGERGLHGDRFWSSSICLKKLHVAGMA
ncbi:hypothetical protein DL98DRAFT_615858 [Cadophora sp. DSE1049]|nr:hypothetical protein DL98DRAFT_615858 [Cadophora sp. DSE1049]